MKLFIGKDETFEYVKFLRRVRKAFIMKTWEGLREQQTIFVGFYFIF